MAGDLSGRVASLVACLPELNVFTFEVFRTSAHTPPLLSPMLHAFTVRKADGFTHSQDGESPGPGLQVLNGLLGLGAGVDGDYLRTRIPSAPRIHSLRRTGRLGADDGILSPTPDANAQDGTDIAAARGTKTRCRSTTSSGIKHTD